MRKRSHREHQLLAVTSILYRVIMIFIQYERLSITYSACGAPLTIERQEWLRSKAVFCALPVFKRASTA